MTRPLTTELDAIPRCPIAPLNPQRWDHDLLIAALQAWTDHYGSPPLAWHWGHTRNGLSEARRAFGREARHRGWPSPATVQRHCGKWSDITARASNTTKAA